MRDWLWHIVERRLRRSLPAAHLTSTIGDLAEDYARRREAVGPVRTRVWLVREARSLRRAYRAAGLGSGGPRLSLGDDLRQAGRRITSRPAAAILCAALLALGIGLSTAMFSVVDALLLRPAPFPAADRLIQQTLFDSEPRLMDAWRTSGMFDAVEAGRLRPFQIEADAGAGNWRGALVTPGVFDLLRVRPVRGRAFTTIDGRPASNDEVMLSESIWRSAFGADPALIGRRVKADGGSALVVGIMPASFRFPTPLTVAWKPFQVVPGQSGGGFTIFGRLKPGVPPQTAELRVRELARELARLPRSYRGSPPVAAVGRVDLEGTARRSLWLLFGGVALVFVVLCANVSNLLLARLSSRRREFGLCHALGASRARLMRQATAEHACIGLAGAAVGIGIAWALTSAIPGVFLDRSLNAIDIDPRALWAASLLGVASVMLSGLVPALVGTRADPLDSLRQSPQAGTEGRSMRLVTRGLLVGEIALACSLLVGSVLLVRSFANLVHADRSLASDGVVRVSVGGMDDAFGSYDAMTLAVAAIEARLAAWPEVSGVGMSREIPPNPTRTEYAHLGPPGSKPDVATAIHSDAYRVSPGFFELYGITILRGRTLEPGDTLQDVVVGTRLADLLWPGQDPLGRSFATGFTSRRVVGLASEIRLPTLDPSLDRPEFYTPLGSESRTLYVNFRCRAACPSDAAIQAQIHAVHPGLRVRVVPPAEDVYLTHLRLPRATAEVAGLFTVVAVLAAAGGLFSLLSYAVGRRRREFGIRTALGASPGQLRELVFRDGASVIAIGMAVGLFGAWIVARSLSAFHYGVTAADPITWAGAIAAIALTSLAAAWRPARQAMRVDPVQLLREE